LILLVFVQPGDRRCVGVRSWRRRSGAAQSGTAAQRRRDHRVRTVTLGDGTAPDDNCDDHLPGGTDPGAGGRGTPGPPAWHACASPGVLLWRLLREAAVRV